MTPNLPEAYFNRAVAYEVFAIITKNYNYYDQSAADLQKVIKISKDPEQIEAAKASIRMMQSKGYIP